MKITFDAYGERYSITLNDFYSLAEILMCLDEQFPGEEK